MDGAWIISFAWRNESCFYNQNFPLGVATSSAMASWGTVSNPYLL